MIIYDIYQLIQHLALLLGLSLIIYILLNIAKCKGEYRYILVKHSILIATIPVFILPAKIKYTGKLLEIKHGFPLRFITQFKTIKSISSEAPTSINFFSSYGRPILGDINFNVTSYLISIYFIYLILKLADKKLNIYKADKI